MEQYPKDNVEKQTDDAETHALIKRRRKIVKPGEYRMSGNRWKRYKPPRYERNEQAKVEYRFKDIITGVPSGNQKKKQTER